MGKISNIQERYDRYKMILKDLTIMNDIFMRNVLKNRECLEYVLQVIMNNHDLKVVDDVIQKDYKNLQGRSAILDCVAMDADGRLMNMEIQQDNEGASPKRARYHSGLMDMNKLESGQDFDRLPESYVIFITRNDILGDDLPIYHINRTINETGKPFRDEAYIVYVNSSKQDDSELGQLMHDLHCKDADEIHSSTLAARVRMLKETERGVNDMCSEMEKLYNEGIEIGKQLMGSEMQKLYNEGIEIGKQMMGSEMQKLYNEGIEIGEATGEANGEAKLISKMYKNGYSVAEISSAIDKDEAEVQAIVDGKELTYI